MKPFRVHKGKVAPLERANIDTDQIIPKQFLKRIERTGFGEFLFYDWRRTSDGRLDPAFSLNQPRYSGASVLVAGKNFGCGSSREHAVWAIEDFGFRAVIAPSFADIFRNNSLKIGLLPVELAQESVRALMDAVFDDATTRIVVDLDERTISAPGVDETFAIDDFTRWRLMEGLDEIGLTLQHDEAIARYEASRDSWLPTA